ncbi:hypothetical protein [Flavobacterium maritimum]|uniref:hypothetical protein n=1 Tax=Flavobacterium maritimum TaxID=3149042 RepID=UPI0032B32362
MKKSFFIIILISILSLSCSVESSVGDLNSNSIIGSWTWQKSVGGIAGSTETPESTGIQKKIVFTGEGKVMVYSNNVEITNTTYEIKKGTSIFDEKERSLIVFDGMTYVVQFIDAHNLTIADNFADGYSSDYKR